MNVKSQPVPPGPLGYIRPEDRTPAQQNAHAAALAARPRFNAGQMNAPTSPVKVVLTDFLKRAEVIADMGRQFNGFRQLTGSCVGVSEGDALAVVSAVQRTIAVGPTKAFIPFWAFPYGRTRLAEGDHGQGEGAVDSVMGDTLGKEGVFDIWQPGLPAFDYSDGLALPASTEMHWSDGAAIEQKWRDLAAQHKLGSHATLSNTNDIKLAICNGYPVLDGCAMYVGNGKVKGSGDNAYTVGHYDGSGGHSTCVVGYWDHPTDGPLFLYWNQWAGSTYPTDPAGGVRCSTWLPESEMAKLFSRYGGDNGETMALSNQAWFPAQPAVLDFGLLV